MQDLIFFNEFETILHDLIYIHASAKF